MLIGTGSYRRSDELPPIPAAANNLHDLRERLAGPGGVLNPDNCRTVLNPVGVAEAGAPIEMAAEQATDTLIVYYTGHGRLDSRGRLYLALPNTDPDRARFTALSIATVREAIAESNAATRILILDCCFSGRAFDALADGPDAVVGQVDITGTYTITSSARNETSYAPRGHRNTAFTAALLTAATLNPDITLDELYFHTQQHLRRHAHPAPRRRADDNAGRLVLFSRISLPESSRTRDEPVEPSSSTDRRAHPGGSPDSGPPDFARQIDLATHAYRDSEQKLGHDHPDTLAARHDLARAYLSAGKKWEALHLYQQTVAARIRVLGSDHPDTLTTRGDLADAYRMVGEIAEAITSFEELLADAERLGGPDTQGTLAIQCKLGDAYLSVGRIDQAIRLYRQTLTERTSVLGSDHPENLTVRGNLAAAYLRAGQTTEAIAMYQQNCADHERVLGPDHPSTLNSRNSLAFGYATVGRIDHAVALFELLFSDHERIYGPHHPNTLTAGHHLAVARWLAGRTDAIPLLERVLADRERLLGAEHASTLATCDSLAEAYESVGRSADAIPLFKRVLADRERRLGAKHADTLVTRNNLSSAYRSVEQQVGRHGKGRKNSGSVSK
ncbi:caspase, EACC1-associated type [Nocardia takedensis]